MTCNNKKEHSDKHARRTALNKDGNFILEAPAGSGKTALLTARFLALLAEVKHPRQILAVTFTRKAAVEMADRITQTLRAARSGASSDDPFEQGLMELGRKALDAHSGRIEYMHDPDTFLVDTFHGFCASIVRGWPLEAEMPPGAKLLEETEQHAMVETAVSEYLQLVSSGRAESLEIEALTRQLAAADNNTRVLSGRLSDLLRRRDRLVNLMGLFENKGFERDFERMVERAAGRTLGRLNAYFSSESESWRVLKNALDSGHSELAGRITGNVPGAGLDDVVHWQAAAQVFLTKGGTLRKAFRAPDFPPGFKKSEAGSFVVNLPDRIADALMLVTQWPEPEKDNIGIDSLADMLILARGSLRRYAALMRMNGIDFMELEIAALRALRHFDRPGESLMFFHERLRHVLVDEAQDINDTQVRILSALTEGWEPGDGRTLFLVGDPKQSIYRFRRAEVSLFDELRDKGLPRLDEGRLRLEPLMLETNFRSRPALVDFANRVFSFVMAEPDKDNDEVDFNPSRAAGTGDGAVAVCLFNFQERVKNDARYPMKNEARRAEAEYLARAVACLQNKHPDASVGVLVPVRTNLAAYVRTFEMSGVPVNLMEGASMLNSVSVRHLLNLFKAMLRPYDDAAWAGSLRAPWCCVPKSVLARLADMEGFRLWSEKIMAGRDLHPEIKRFMDAYEKIVPDFGRAPYCESIQRLWEEMDGPGAAMGRGSAELANAMEFFNLMRQCPDGTGEESLRGLELLLERAYTPPDPRAAFSNVSIMTIHRAKGLEFDHVFAAGLDYDSTGRSGGRAETPAFLIDRLPGPDRAYMASCSTDRRTGRKKLAACLLDILEKGRTSAEQKRLFYVAATRARESLTLTGLFQRKAQGKNEGGTECPVNWIRRANETGLFKDASFRFLEDPEPPDIVSGPGRVFPELADPPPFEPQRLPYIIGKPSELDDESAMPARAGVQEHDPAARARGVVMHRIFDELAEHDRTPDADAVACALAAEGIGKEYAAQIADDVLRECERAWSFGQFRELRAESVALVPEWAIEDYMSPDGLRIGRVDLLIKKRDGAVLVDYKTGAVSGNEDDWICSETRKYNSQVRAYMEMAGRVLESARIKGVLFFTSIPRLVDVEMHGNA